MGSEILTCVIAAGPTSAGFLADEVSALYTPTGTTLRVLATVGRGTQRALESMRGRSVRFRAHRGRTPLDPTDSDRWTLTAVLVGQVQAGSSPTRGGGCTSRGDYARGSMTTVFSSAGSAG